MAIIQSKNSQTVAASGAHAGSVLRGFAANNLGLRVRVAEAQPRGSEGGLKGSFVILDVGDNKHADALTPLLYRATHADEVRDAIRRVHPGVVNVVNTNLLVLD